MLPHAYRSPFRTTIRKASELQAAARKNGADVVSIDMFDTLVYRTVAEPSDVFRLQYQARPELFAGLEIERWLALRQDAERAVDRAFFPAEIDIGQIYDAVADAGDLGREACSILSEEELTQQRRVISPYRDVIDALRELHREGATVAVVTDIYLPGRFIREILDNFLDFEYTLLCSSETLKTKRSGEAYVLLKATFPGRTIVHFGDNHHSDVRMARKAGLTAFETAWARHAALCAQPVRRYIRTLGVGEIETPWDDRGPDRRATGGVVDEVAWTWSLVLADFLLSARAYARQIGATDVWFVSRDCETMFRSVSDVPELFRGMTCRYVYGSRACVYPLIAASEPELYERWYGRPADHEDTRLGASMQAYFESLVDETTQHVLIVDVGWRGRMQAALSRILPDRVAVSGFYFSLEPRAEHSTKARSGLFIPWDLSVLATPVVEILAGFAQPSVIGVTRTEAGFQPRFRDGPGDRSSPSYCEALHRYLSVLLRNHVDGCERPDPHLRAEVVREISLYPSKPIVDELAQWSIGSRVDGSDTGSITSGGGASRLDRLIGRSVSGNFWPSAAVWTLTSNPIGIRALQHGIRVKMAAKRRIFPDRP